MKKRPVLGEIKNTFTSIAKGMWVTLSHLFRKKVTVMYPEEKIQVSPVFRGMVSLPVNPKTGTDNCIGCGACAKICPDGIIDIKTEVGEDKKRKVVEFTIDFSRCMWCGLCTEVCPKDAIEMSHFYEAATNSRQGMVFNRSGLNELGGTFPVEEEQPDNAETEVKKEAAE